MTKDEAYRYLHLLEIAYYEGLGETEDYELGERLRDEHFPGSYQFLFHPITAEFREESRKPDTVPDYYVYPLHIGNEGTLQAVIEGVTYTFKEAYPVVFANQNAVLDAARAALRHIGSDLPNQCGLTVVGPKEFVAEIRKQHEEIARLESEKTRAERLQRKLRESRWRFCQMKEQLDKAIEYATGSAKRKA